jgi:PD-(D/E)XK endonuclease
VAHETVTKGRYAELLAQTALLANGWSVAEPIAPEPFDLVAQRPGTSEWLKIQVKTARVRDDRNGEIVVCAKKSGGKVYKQNEVDAFIAVLDGNVYLFPNKGLSEYWISPTKISEKWIRLSTDITATG